MKQKTILGMAAAVIVVAGSVFAAANSSSGASKQKQCDELSQQTGEKYYYGEAQLVHFAEAYPPAGTPVNRNIPRSYAAAFSFEEKDTVTVYISGKWENTYIPEHQWKLAPLKTPMISGKKYGFCYQQRGNSVSKHSPLYIDYPDTIELLGE